MNLRVLQFGVDDVARAIEQPQAMPTEGWAWIDITAGPDDTERILEFAERFGLDAMAVRDAIADTDLLKVDNFGETVLDVFDNRNEELNELALKAAPGFLAEITAVRADLAALRKSVHPQREALDILRRTSSPVLTEAGRRRFSDVFDTASRAAQGVEAARTAQLVGAVVEISATPLRTIAGSVARRH